MKPPPRAAGEKCVTDLREQTEMDRGENENVRDGNDQLPSYVHALPPTRILTGDGANFPTRQSNWECCQLLCIFGGGAKNMKVWRTCGLRGRILFF